MIRFGLIGYMEITRRLEVTNSVFERAKDYIPQLMLPPSRRSRGKVNLRYCSGYIDLFFSTYGTRNIQRDGSLVVLLEQFKNHPDAVQYKASFQDEFTRYATGDACYQWLTRQQIMLTLGLTEDVVEDWLYNKPLEGVVERDGEQFITTGALMRACQIYLP